MFISEISEVTSSYENKNRAVRMPTLIGEINSKKIEFKIIAFRAKYVSLLMG
jgi:hypothetical protein